MSKKKSTKIKPRTAVHRHFRPSYSAHPAVHLSSVFLFIFLLAMIISYIIFGAQNPYLFQ